MVILAKFFLLQENISLKVKSSERDLNFWLDLQYMFNSKLSPKFMFIILWLKKWRN